MNNAVNLMMHYKNLRILVEDNTHLIRFVEM